jgi:archaemetzincin
LSPGWLDRIPETDVPESARRNHPLSDDLQFDSIYIIEKLLPGRVPGDAAAVVALTGTDLWPGNDWNFVLGQGSLGRPTGVVSLNRLRGPEPESRMLLRTLKIATHEIGHLFGMPHCKAYECGMNGANSLQETDRHPLAFCPECEAKVWLVGGADPAERYRRLAEFANRYHLETEAELWTKSAAALGPKTKQNGR